MAGNGVTLSLLLLPFAARAIGLKSHTDHSGQAGIIPARLQLFLFSHQPLRFSLSLSDISAICLITAIILCNPDQVWRSFNQTMLFVARTVRVLTHPCPPLTVCCAGEFCGNGFGEFISSAQTRAVFQPCG